MEHISLGLSDLVQDLIAEQRDLGRDDRALQLEEAAFSTAWYQPVNPDSA